MENGLMRYTPTSSLMMPRTSTSCMLVDTVEMLVCMCTVLKHIFACATTKHSGHDCSFYCLLCTQQRKQDLNSQYVALTCRVNHRNSFRINVSCTMLLPLSCDYCKYYEFVHAVEGKHRRWTLHAIVTCSAVSRSY